MGRLSAGTCHSYFLLCDTHTPTQGDCYRLPYASRPQGTSLRHIGTFTHKPMADIRPLDIINTTVLKYPNTSRGRTEGAEVALQSFSNPTRYTVLACYRTLDHPAPAYNNKPLLCRRDLTVVQCDNNVKVF